MPENNGDDYYPMDQMTENNGLQCMYDVLSCHVLQCKQCNWRECKGGGVGFQEIALPHLTWSTALHFYHSVTTQWCYTKIQKHKSTKIQKCNSMYSSSIQSILSRAWFSFKLNYVFKVILMTRDKEILDSVERRHQSHLLSKQFPVEMFKF